MTLKQIRFVDEYLIDLNATQAAIRAGYSKNTARQIGEQLLSKLDIKLAIDKRLAEIHTKHVASAQEVEEYLTNVLRGRSQAEIVVVEGRSPGISSARRIMKCPDEKERLKAAELLAKRHGILTDKMKVEGGVQVVIKDDLKDDVSHG